MSPTLKAALWMTGAIASFSSMAVAGRELSGAHDTFEIMLYRSLFGALVIVIVITATSGWGRIARDHLGLHALRNLAHFTGQNLWFFAVTAIPLAQVFALEFTTPLWVIVLSPLFLGERLTRLRAIAAVVGFLGILIVARPDMGQVSPGMLAAAASAVFFALTFMLTKRLTRDNSILTILFYLTTMQLIFGLIAAGYDGQITWPTARSLPYLALVGVAGLLAHTCITNALAIAPAAIVAPMDFVRLPVIAIVGMLLYQEAIDVWVFLGAAIIFLGNYLNIWGETRKAR